MPILLFQLVIVDNLSCLNRIITFYNKSPSNSRSINKWRQKGIKISQNWANNILRCKGKSKWKWEGIVKLCYQTDRDLLHLLKQEICQQIYSNILNFPAKAVMDIMVLLDTINYLLNMAQVPIQIIFRCRTISINNFLNDQHIINQPWRWTVNILKIQMPRFRKIGISYKIVIMKEVEIIQPWTLTLYPQYQKQSTPRILELREQHRGIVHKTIQAVRWRT